MNEYLLGNIVRVTAYFNNSGTAVNPAAVMLYLKKGNNNKVLYVYGVNPEIVRPTTGTYYMDVEASIPGLYTYNWFSTGTGQAAGQDNFVVTDSIGN